MGSVVLLPGMKPYCCSQILTSYISLVSTSLSQILIVFRASARAVPPQCHFRQVKTTYIHTPSFTKSQNNRDKSAAILCWWHKLHIESVQQHLGIPELWYHAIPSRNYCCNIIQVLSITTISQNQFKHGIAKISWVQKVIAGCYVSVMPASLYLVFSITNDLILLSIRRGLWLVELVALASSL